MTKPNTDKMTEAEQALLSDPFIEPTTDVNWPARSDAFKAAWYKRFNLEPPMLSEFDEALEQRALEDASPGTRLRGAVNALLRSESGRAELMERDPQFKTRIKGQLIAEAAEEFRRRCTDYIPGPDDINRDTLVEIMHKNFFGYWPNPGFDFDEVAEKLWDAGHWEPDNLVEAYEEGVRLGLMALPGGQVRQLSEMQKLEIISTGQIEGPEFAVLKYLEYALGEPRNERTAAEVNRWRASNSQIWNTAVLWVFQHLHGQILNEQQWPEFETMMRERTPLLQYQALYEGMQEFRRAAKPSLLRAENGQTTRENLDELSDEEIAKQLMQARRAAAKVRGAA